MATTFNRRRLFQSLAAGAGFPVFAQNPYEKAGTSANYSPES